MHRPSIRRHVIPLLAGAACLAGTLSAQEANMNSAHIRPTAVIPFMAKAPVIDGVIGDGEWNTLHVAKFVSQGGDLLQQRPGEFWVGCDGKRLFIAVRSGVHPTLGAIAKVPKGVGAKDEMGAVYDDSIELWINNNPGGDVGQYYQILVNSAGALYDQSFDVKEKIGQTYWRVAMEQAHKVADGLWTAEFAIDLANLGIADPTRPLAMRVCRNFKYNWDQSRWAPLVRSFDSPETMPLVRFAAVAPVVSEVGFQDDKGIAVAVDLTNPTAKPLPVKVKLGYNAESQPRYFQEIPAELKPGATQRFEYRKEFFTGENYPALAEILVTGADGAVLHHRDVKWQTKPKGPIWAPVGSASAEEAVQFGFEFHPTPRVIRWQVEFAGMKGREGIKAARLEVVPKAGGQPIFTATAKPSAEFAVAARAETVKDLRDGMYEARLYLDGAELAAKPVKTASVQMRSDFPWLGNKIGKDDIVIPPFTPVEVKGQTIKTVLRDHLLGGNGLWEQITAEGRPILAGPMRIEVVRDGKIEVATGKASVRFPGLTAAVTESTWETLTVKGNTQMSIEYDGCAKVTLLFAPKGDRPIDALRVVIPLADKEAPLMHAAGDGIRFNYAGKVPAGDGRVWSSDKASRSQLLGTFLPYLWVGGETRGLCWFAANDRNWVLDPKDEVPDLELVRRNGVLELHVNLIQVPTTLTGPHKVVFGLQATPTRPMPDDWRRTGIVSNDPTDYKILGMCMYWGCDLYTVVPRGADYEVVRKISAVGRGEGRDNAFFDSYTAKNPDIRNEILWSANGGAVAGIIPYTNLRGDNSRTPEWFVYQDEWRKDPFSDRLAEPGTGGPVDFCVALPPSRVDYLMYQYKQFLDAGFAAPYWDNAYIVSNGNPASGEAYTRPTGGIQPEADLWRIREVTKRTAILLHQMGKRNASVPHTTNAYLIPAFTWSGFNLDWEWKYGGTDFQERFTRDYIRACSLGRQSGSIPMALQGITEVSDPAMVKWVERTRIAACVPHEIKVWQTDPLFGKLTRKMLELGYGTPDCTVHNYWEDEPVVRIAGMDGIWLLLAGKSTVMLVVSDYGNGGTAKVTLDTKRLGLPADFAAVNWEKADDTVTAVGGTVELKDFRKHDFRVLLIAKP